MDCDDSDLEMIGSPVLPKVKNEADDDEAIITTVETITPDDPEGIALEDSYNDDMQSDNVENEDADRDPMNLLQLLGAEGSCDNDKEDSHDNDKENSDEHDSEVAISTLINEVKAYRINPDLSNGHERNYEHQNGTERSLNNEAGTSNEKESIDAENENRDQTNEKIPSNQNETAAERTRRQIDNLAETLTWICRDGENTDRVFCLYCNANLNAKHIYHLSVHDNTQLHKERAAEYLGFIENCGDDIVRIKTNKDFDGDIKKEREKLEDKYADYVWGLWTKAHDWIVRTNKPGYIGYCKFCRIEISAHSSRNRKGHEDGHRHNEAKKASIKRRKTISSDATSLDDEQSNGSSDKASKEPTEPVKNSSVKAQVSKENEYLEKSKSSSDLCRCKLCDITMFTTSFYRHSTSNLHKQNLAVLNNPVVTDQIEKPQWHTFQALHPWLIEDPSNPMEAFCKYCEKRILYGASAAKRLIHEHSAPHKAAVKKSAEAVAAKAKEAENREKNFQQTNNVSYKESAEESTENDHGYSHDEALLDNGGGEDNSENESAITEQEGNETESKTGNDNESETGTESESEYEMESQNRRRSFKRPPYLKLKKGGKYVFCRYCKVKLQNITKNMKSHCNSQKHMANAKIFLTRSNAVDSGKSITETTTGPPSSPATITYSTSNEYPWLVKFKSNRDVVFCKYCRVRFSSKANRMQHQNTKAHIEAALKYEEKSFNKDEFPELETQKVPPLKVVIKQPIAPPKIVVKKKVTQNQLKCMFDWLQFKKGMQLNYGYCTLCEKSFYVPSIKFGYKHKRTGFHIRALNTFRRNQKERQNPTQKRSRIEEESDKETDKNTEKENVGSQKDSEGPPKKRLKPCSLYTAIQTAKRLTSIHLEMLTFMRNSGRNVPIDLDALAIAPSPTPVRENQTPSKALADASSSIKDLNATLSPIVHAATLANKRDQFDLFFNSMSESIKVLPPDLASEAKLKVMQVIFELETRAQLRQQQQKPQQEQQSEQLCPIQTTQEQQQQKLPTIEQNNVSLHDNINGNLDDILLPEPMVIESLPDPIIIEAESERETARMPQRSNQQLQQLHSQMQSIQTQLQQQKQSQNQKTPVHQLCQSPYNISKGASPSGMGAARKFYVQPMSGNSAGTQQRQLVATSSPQPSSNAMQTQRSSAAKVQATSTAPIQANTIVHNQRKIQPHQQQQQQQVAQHNIQTTIGQQPESLLRHRVVTNQVNNLVNNVNQRIVNNQTMSPKTNAGLTISSVNSLANEIHNNGSSARRTGPPSQARTVPLSSLTKAKYQNTLNDEVPPFHQIQLNSSTQSKIITIDANNYQRR